MKCACIQGLCAALRESCQEHSAARVDDVVCANEVISFDGASTGATLQIPFRVSMSAPGYSGHITTLVAASFCPFCGSPTGAGELAAA